MVSPITSTRPVSASTVLQGSTVTTQTQDPQATLQAQQAVAASQRSLRELNERLAAEAAETERLKRDKPQADGPVQVFEKRVRKSPFSSASFATDVGILVRNQSRLNVFSAFSNSDTADHFRFRVNQSGNATIGVLGGEGLRFQIRTKFGVTVADSDPKSGVAFENYEKLQKSNLDLKPGEYTLSVTRAGRAPTRGEPINYAVQLAQGRYRRDFDTVANQPRPGDGLPQQSAAASSFQQGLLSASNFVKSLPPIGTPATAKLSGLFINQVF